eukprot:gene17168-26349_t
MTEASADTVKRLWAKEEAERWVDWLAARREKEQIRVWWTAVVVVAGELARDVASARERLLRRLRSINGVILLAVSQAELVKVILKDVQTFRKLANGFDDTSFMPPSEPDTKPGSDRVLLDVAQLSAAETNSFFMRLRAQLSVQEYCVKFAIDVETTAWAWDHLRLAFAKEQVSERYRLTVRSVAAPNALMEACYGVYRHPAVASAVAVAVVALVVGGDRPNHHHRRASRKVLRTSAIHPLSDPSGLTQTTAFARFLSTASHTIPALSPLAGESVAAFEKAVLSARLYPLSPPECDAAHHFLSPVYHPVTFSHHARRTAFAAPGQSGHLRVIHGSALCETLYKASQHPPDPSAAAEQSQQRPRRVGSTRPTPSDTPAPPPAPPGSPGDYWAVSRVCSQRRRPASAVQRKLRALLDGAPPEKAEPRPPPRQGAAADGPAAFIANGAAIDRGLALAVGPRAKRREGPPRGGASEFDAFLRPVGGTVGKKRGLPAAGALPPVDAGPPLWPAKPVVHLGVVEDSVFSDLTRAPEWGALCAVDAVCADTAFPDGVALPPESYPVACRVFHLLRAAEQRSLAASMPGARPDEAPQPALFFVCHVDGDGCVLDAERYQLILRFASERLARPPASVFPRRRVSGHVVFASTAANHPKDHLKWFPSRVAVCLLTDAVLLHDIANSAWYAVRSGAQGLTSDALESFVTQFYDGQLESLRTRDPPLPSMATLQL